jgi:parallel beta-helix repeat protein
MAVLASIDRALSLKAAHRPQSVQEWAAVLSASAAAPANAAAMNRLPQPPIATAAEAQADDKADEPASAAPEARRFWFRAAAVVLVLIALPVAVVSGRIYYLRQIKSEWVVDAQGNGDVKSLTQAMTSARTNATIHVRPGRYAEALVMERPLTIQGIGDAAEIVVAAPGPGPCVTITANGGAISGLSFIGGTGSTDVSSDACVEIAGASTVSMSGIIIRNTAGPGLRIGEDAAPVVRGNRIEQISSPAIIIQDRATGTVAANAIIAGGAPGILVRDAAAPLVAENRIDSTGQAGILVTGGSTPGIAGNHITNSAWSGIEVRGRADPAVTGNRIEGAGQAGIYVYDGGHGTYQDNIVVGSAYSGVVVGADAEPLMTGNRITGNREHGILVLARGKGRYQGNTITDNAGHGLALDVDATPVHADNALAGNLDPPIVIGETVVEEKPAVDENRTPQPRSQLAPDGR